MSDTAIKVKCGKCGNTLRGRMKHCGRLIDCPACGAEQKIPSREEIINATPALVSCALTGKQAPTPESVPDAPAVSAAPAAEGALPPPGDGYQIDLRTVQIDDTRGDWFARLHDIAASLPGTKSNPVRIDLGAVSYPEADILKRVVYAALHVELTGQPVEILASYTALSELQRMNLEKLVTFKPSQRSPKTRRVTTSRGIDVKSLLADSKKEAEPPPEKPVPKWDGTERRGSPRHAVKHASSVEVTKEERVDKTRTGMQYTDVEDRVVEISAEGCRLATGRRMDAGTQLGLTLNVTDVISGLEVKGKVVWVRTVKEADQICFHVGVLFVSIPGMAMIKLSRLMKKLAES